MLAQQPDRLTAARRARLGLDLPPEERRLARRQRLIQLAIATAATRDLLDLWVLLDPDNLTGSTPGWIRAATATIDRHRVTAATAAIDYATDAARLAGVTPWLPPPPPTPTAAVAVSLQVTGPVRIQRAIANGLPVEAAMQVAANETARAGTRHVLNAGREVVVAATTRTRGGRWYRIPGGSDPCDFCLMLAGRGAVYRESTVGFQAHDGCACTAAARFSST